MKGARAAHASIRKEADDDGGAGYASQQLCHEQNDGSVGGNACQKHDSYDWSQKWLLTESCCKFLPSNWR